MKLSILAFTLFLIGSLNAQKIVLFERYELDSTYSLVGIPAYYAKEKTLDKLSFIIKDLETLKKIKEDWVFDKKVRITNDENTFSVYLLKGNEIVKSWDIHPNSSNIFTNNTGYYFFDIEKVTQLSAKNHLNYRIQENIVKSSEDFYLFQEKSKKDSSFLFLFTPLGLNFEGSFEIEVERTDVLNSPAAASQELKKLFSKIIPDENAYLIGYPLNEKNLRYPKQMTLSINSPKKMFDLFSDNVFKKSNWKPTVLKVVSFWKKTTNYYKMLFPNSK